jgi:hypothetical protein
MSDEPCIYDDELRHPQAQSRSDIESLPNRPQAFIFEETAQRRDVEKWEQAFGRVPLRRAFAPSLKNHDRTESEDQVH